MFFPKVRVSSDSLDETAASSEAVKRTPFAKPNMPLTRTTSYLKQLSELADKFNDVESGIGGSFSGQQSYKRADKTHEFDGHETNNRKLGGKINSDRDQRCYVGYETTSFVTIEMEKVVTDSKYQTLPTSSMEDVKNIHSTLNQVPQAISVAQEICGSQAKICNENDYTKKSAYGVQAEKNICIEIPSIIDQENTVSVDYNNLADGFEGLKVNTTKPQPSKRNFKKCFSSLKKYFYLKKDSIKEGEQEEQQLVHCMETSNEEETSL